MIFASLFAISFTTRTEFALCEACICFPIVSTIHKYVYIWNSPPSLVTSNDSLTTFKSRLKTFLFRLVFGCSVYLNQVKPTSAGASEVTTLPRFINQCFIFFYYCQNTSLYKVLSTLSISARWWFRRKMHALNVLENADERLRERR